MKQVSRKRVSLIGLIGLLALSSTWLGYWLSKEYAGLTEPPAKVRVTESRDFGMSPAGLAGEPTPTRPVDAREALELGEVGAVNHQDLRMPSLLGLRRQLSLEATH